MTAPLLAVGGLVKKFGALLASDALDLTVMPGEIHAVIGPNGAGKTTLLGQLAGELAPDRGSITFRGYDITPLPEHKRVALGLVRSFQMSSIFPAFSALENVVLAVQAQAGHSFRFWRPVRTITSLYEQAWNVLERVGLATRAETLAVSLSHGEQRQLDIAMALAAQPRLLLLDEPTAGMGAEESAQMATLLGTLRGECTILLVEHDMDVVFALADRITVLVDGRAIATGTASAIRTNPQVRRAYLGEDDEDSRALR
jgi:branched-chain amino acid transport system ATP-binding protein